MSKTLDIEQKIVEEAKKSLKDGNKLLRYCVSDAILTNISFSELTGMGIYLSDYVDYIIEKMKEDENNG